jgi:hypothetical protein
MTITLELKCGVEGFRAHPLRERWILSGNSKILHVLSEDILTANVFGILKNLDPRVWLVSFLQNACCFSNEDFPHLYQDDNYSEFLICLWHDLDQPPRQLEGKTQADVFIVLKSALIMIECKGFAPLQKYVSTDDLKGDAGLWWDQAIRNIVRGYIHSKRHFAEKDFFFVVLSMSDKEETFRQYEDGSRIKKQVENRIVKDPEIRRFFPNASIDTICQKLSRHIRWVKWTDLKEALEKSSFNEKGDFNPQTRFCKDVVDYLELKIRLWSTLMTRKSR